MSKHETKHDKAIRERALEHWRKDGSPAGRLDEYLERARELQAIIDNPTAGQLPNPMTVHHNEGASGQPVEEAELLENLGEFRSLRGEDQGDQLQAPMTRKKARQFRQEN